MQKDKSEDNKKTTKKYKGNTFFESRLILKKHLKRHFCDPIETWS